MPSSDDALAFSAPEPSTSFRLKGINVKDIQGNERAKGKSENLWRYRALRHGYYVFKHEYVMVLQRPE